VRIIHTVESRAIPVDGADCSTHAGYQTQPLHGVRDVSKRRGGSLRLASFPRFPFPILVDGDCCFGEGMLWGAAGQCGGVFTLICHQCVLVTVSSRLHTHVTHAAEPSAELQLIRRHSVALACGLSGPMCEASISAADCVDNKVPQASKDTMIVA